MRAGSLFVVGLSIRSGFGGILICCALLGVFSLPALSQTKFESLEIADVIIAFDESSLDAASGEEFRLIARRPLGTS